jgi:hypothetical protein
MHLIDFIKQDEIDGLPDDDPQEAFTQFVRITQRRLHEKVESLAGNEQDQWQAINDARYGFMNIVIAAAKKFEIPPLSALDVPRGDGYSDVAFRQFQSDLDHYVTQLVLENSSRAKRESVFVSPELKTKINTYIHHLRETIQKSDLADEKKAALLEKLRGFEAELEKRRLNLMTVTMVILALASAPGGIWTTGEAAQKLVSNILRGIGEAKQADDEARKRLLPMDQPKAIAPPRAPDPITQKRPLRKTAQNDMDDDIPF